MSGGRARRSLLAALAVGMVALLGSSCAPPPPGGLESLEQTARRMSDRRERRLSAFEAHAVLRVDGRATGKLPAVTVHVRVASPDRVRIQLHWLLGLLADVSARGDTLTAWVPGDRLGLSVPDLADSLGVREPARFLARALSAGWSAPHEAWRQGVLDSAGARLAWDERDEHWTLRVGRDGRPREASVARGEHIVRARYDRWRGAGSAAWPGRVELEDGSGWLKVRFDIDDLHATRKPRARWFALVLPDDAKRLELDDVKRILSSRGGLP
jgi:hypothetical protein